MKQTVIVGVDVSKSTLDIFMKPSGTFLQIPNNAAGFKKWLVALNKVTHEAQTVLVVMEYTGRYSYLFEQFLQRKNIGYCKIAALQIKRSLGVTRGKNDKIDAERIAEYGWLRRDVLQAADIIQPQIQQLQSLLGLRRKLVGDRAGYIARVKEMLATGSCTISCFEVLSQRRTIKYLSTEIAKVEQQIKSIIQANEALSKTNELLQSIRGIGWIVAIHMICYTCNFKKFANARKFKCYAGLAPFGYESGSSVRGRSRVSHLANKEAKTLLNLAAFTAIRHDTELRAYYQRRIAEGKRKMSCVNIVRAKIVDRMFAVIKRQSPYCQLAA
jgi:transposase